MYTAYCRNSGILVPYFGMLYWLHAIDGSVFDLCIRRQLPTTAYWTLPHHVLIDTFTMLHLTLLNANKYYEMYR